MLHTLTHHVLNPILILYFGSIWFRPTSERLFWCPVVLPPRESLGQRQTQIEIFALQKPAKRFFLLLTLSLGISWPHHATDDVFLDLISSRNMLQQLYIYRVNTALSVDDLGSITTTHMMFDSQEVQTLGGRTDVPGCGTVPSSYSDLLWIFGPDEIIPHLGFFRPRRVHSLLFTPD